MQFKKFFTTLAATSLLVGGALFVGESAKSHEVKEARATTDLGTFTFSEANGDSAVGYMYGVNLITNEAPEGWDSPAFAPVGEESGTFVNGVRVGTEIKKLGPNTYYIPVPDATVGTVATVKGTWANSDYSFTVNEFVREWNGSKWDYALEEYDVLSLKDANLPDYEYTTIDTENPAGYGYIGYDESEYAKKFAQKNHGLFGYTNQTSSYSFQFYFEVNGTMSSWLDIRIGASGGWGTGHYLFFKLSNAWNNGVLQVYEQVNDATYDGHFMEVQTDITTGKRLLEMGSIKVKGYENKYYVFFKNNGVVAYDAYWDLAEGQRSTKVGIYHNASDVSITNSYDSAKTKFELSTSSNANSLYFNTATDVLPFISTWGNWFSPQDATGFTYNGADGSDNKWNYFKKVGATANSFFFNLPDLGITPASGDILHLGGTFKIVDYVNGITVLYRVVIQDIDLQFDGTAWHAIDPDYLASDFAVDLLKMTLGICDGTDKNNKALLEPVWAVLADSEHYGSLTLNQIEVLVNTVADSEIVVPTTEADIENMDADDALKAAMYRYDFCASKYELATFINGRVVPSSSVNNYSEVYTNNSVSLIIIIVSSVFAISLLGVIVLKKRRHK